MSGWKFIGSYSLKSCNDLCVLKLRAFLSSGSSSTRWMPLTKTRVQIQASAWRPPSSTWSILWFSPFFSWTSSWLWSSSPSRSRETKPCQSAAWRRMRCATPRRSNRFQKYNQKVVWNPGLAALYFLGKLATTSAAVCLNERANKAGFMSSAFILFPSHSCY